MPGGGTVTVVSTYIHSGTVGEPSMDEHFLREVRLVDAAVRILRDGDHVRDRLAPRQLVGVVLVRPDEHHRPLGHGDLRAQVVPVVQASGDAQPEAGRPLGPQLVEEALEGREVVGVDLDPQSRKLAVELGVVDRCEDDLLVACQGADVIQLDEPWLQARPERAVRYGVKAINRALEGITVPTVVHLCFGYAHLVHDRPPGYSFLAELNDCSVDFLAIEAAHPSVTRDHAAEMAELTYFSHDSPRPENATGDSAATKNTDARALLSCRTVFLCT